MNYIQQAYKGEVEWYYWLITIIIVFFGWQFFGVIPLAIGAFMHVSDINELMIAAENSFTIIGMNKNLLLFLMILTFVFGLLSLFVAIKTIHKRTIKSLITSREKIDWKRFGFGFISWGVIATVFALIGIFISPEHYTFNFNAKPFFILLSISLLFLPLQTSFEELLFRGYFMQGIGILAKNRWIPLIITSVCFGLLHFANPEVQKLGNISMVFYIGTGFFYGITTLMDEGLELSLGLHAINNIIAAILVTTNWTAIQTDAIFIDTSEPSASWEILFPVLILYPLLLFIFSKKYGWTNWKDKLFGKIVKPETNILDKIGCE